MSEYPATKDTFSETTPVPTSPRDNPSLARNVERAFQAIAAIEDAVGTWSTGIVIFDELNRFIYKSGGTFTGEVVFNEGLTSHKGLYSPFPLEHNPSALGNQYPYGITHMAVLQEDGWPVGGLVTTVRTESSVMQWLSSGQHEQYVRWGVSEWTPWVNFARDPNTAHVDHDHDTDYARLDHDHPLQSHSHPVPSHSHGVPSHSHGLLHSHEGEEPREPSPGDFVVTDDLSYPSTRTLTSRRTFSSYIFVPSNWSKYTVNLQASWQGINTDSVGHGMYWYLIWDGDEIKSGSNIIEAGPSYYREVTLSASKTASGQTSTGRKKFAIALDSIGATDNIKASDIDVSCTVTRVD